MVLQKRQSEVDAALTLGVPPCIRMMLWDKMLNLTELTNANLGLFEALADTEMLSNDEENVIEKIERDLDRTLPYHPLFRNKLGKGQTDMQKVFWKKRRGRRNRSSFFLRFCELSVCMTRTLGTARDSTSSSQLC